MTKTTEITCMILLLAGAGLATADEPTTSDEFWQQAVCRVNGSEILRRDVEAEKQKQLPGSNYHGKVDASKHQALRRRALQTLIDHELQYQDAQKRGLVVPAKEVDREYDQLVSKFSDKRALKAQFKRLGVSEKEVKQAVRHRLTVERVEQEVASSGDKASRADALRYYEENREVFKLPQRAEVRQILLKLPPLERDNEDWQKANDLANSLRDRLLAGESFESLVAETDEGDWKGLVEGTTLAKVHPGQLKPALDKALWQLEVGDVSQPIRSFKGVFLLILDQLLEPEQMPFDEIADRLAVIVDRERAIERKASWLAQLRADGDIEILDPALSPEEPKVEQSNGD